MDELNDLVASGDVRDDRRRIFGRPITVGQHFEIEAPELRPLPAVRFDKRREQRGEPREPVGAGLHDDPMIAGAMLD